MIARLAIVALMSATCFLVATAIAAGPPSRICILNLERPEHPMTAIVHDVFQTLPEAEIHDLAVPMDFLNCVKSRTSEILILGHALETPLSEGTQAPLNLAYFRELKDSERQSAIDKNIAYLSDALKELPGSNETSTKRKQLSELLRSYQTFASHEPYYVVRSFLPHIMTLAREELRRQSQKASGVALRRIRLMSCMPEQVLREYPDLVALAHENSIELDVAPTNGLLSAWEGKPVAVPDIAWISKSVDCSKLSSWRTDSNSYCRYDWWPGCDRATPRYCLPPKD